MNSRCQSAVRTVRLVLTVVPEVGSVADDARPAGVVSVDELVRGAWRTLAEALQTEVDDYTARHAGSYPSDGVAAPTLLEGLQMIERVQPLLAHPQASRIARHGPSESQGCGVGRCHSEWPPRPTCRSRSAVHELQRSRCGVGAAVRGDVEAVDASCAAAAVTGSDDPGGRPLACRD